MASSPLHHAADSAAGALFSAIPDAEVRGVLKRCVDLVQAQPGRWPAMTVMLRPYFAADAADAAMGAGSSGFGHGAGVELRVDVSTSGDTQQQPVFTPEASVVRHNGHGADAAGGSRAYRRSLGMTPARMDREIDALAEQLDFGSGGEEEGKVDLVGCGWRGCCTVHVPADVLLARERSRGALSRGRVNFCVRVRGCDGLRSVGRDSVRHRRCGRGRRAVGSRGAVGGVVTPAVLRSCSRRAPWCRSATRTRRCSGRQQGA